MKDVAKEYVKWDKRKEELINQYKSTHRFSQQLEALSELVRLTSKALDTRAEPDALPLLMKLIKILRLISRSRDTDYMKKVEDDIDGARFKKEMEEALKPMRNFLEELETYGPDFIDDNFSDKDVKEFEELCKTKFDYKEWMDEINEEIDEEKKELAKTLSQVLDAYSKEKRIANCLNQLADILAIAYSVYFDTNLRRKLLHLVYKELKKISQKENKQ